MRAEKKNSSYLQIIVTKNQLLILIFARLISVNKSLNKLSNEKV
jgi:hypothetical protein